MMRPSLSNGHSAIPILGQAPTKPQAWQCVAKPEHQFVGDEPPRMPLIPVTGKPGVMIASAGYCPFCFGEWLGQMFPVQRVILGTERTEGQ